MGVGYIVTPKIDTTVNDLTANLAQNTAKELLRIHASRLLIVHKTKMKPFFISLSRYSTV